MTELNTWDGHERRSIPIEVLNVMEAKLEKHEAVVEEKLNAIHKRIDEVSKRIDALITSINSWMQETPDALMDRCERMLDEAIPHHPDNPDASPAEKRHEHRHAHAQWIKRVDEEVRKWESVRQEVVKWAVIGGLSVIAVAVWQYLLKGPV